MVEQRFQAIVERVNSLLVMTRSLAREEFRDPAGAPDLDRLKTEAARLTADIDAARDEVGSARSAEQPARVRSSIETAAWPPVGVGAREQPAVPGYWFG